MKLNTIVLLLCAITCMASCSKKRGEHSDLSDKEEVRCLCPPVIHLQPFGKFSQRSTPFVTSFRHIDERWPYKVQS